MELGELISFYRRRAGLTIDELAEKSGVPKSTINKIIGGVTKAPTLENVKSIARALGVKLADFDDDPEIPDMFSPSELEQIKKYRSLDPYGKEAVDSVLDVEWRRCTEPAEEQSGNVIKIAARDGSFTELCLTDDQIKDLQAYINQLPDPGDDL